MGNLVEKLITNPEQVGKIIDLISSIEGMYWVFNKRVTFENKDLADINMHVRSFFAQRLGLPSAYIISHPLMHSDSLKSNFGTVRIGINYKGAKTGAEIVKEGFFFAYANHPPLEPNALIIEQVKLAGQEYWSCEPQKTYELIIHNNPESPVQEEVVNLLRNHKIIK